MSKEWREELDKQFAELERLEQKYKEEFGEDSLSRMSKKVFGKKDK